MNFNYRMYNGWYCYAKDYIGNVRRVYKVDINKKQYALAQVMNYYASGVPFDIAKNPDLQPYKYTGKELVEEHGLDEYDNEARWYYPALARTTTMDPHCENYYDQSPYSWCGNNFVNAIDPEGMDTLTINYNTQNNKWDISKPIIAEGDDVFNVTDKNGNYTSHTFNEGEYGNRMNIVLLEDNVDIDESFGVYHLSGTEDVGYVIQPSSNPKNGDHYNKRGIYSTYVGTGTHWTNYIGLSGNGATPGVRVHYGQSRSWSTGCLIISSDYLTKSDGSIGFNLGVSQEAAWGFAQYAGATMRKNIQMGENPNRYRDYYSYGNGFRSPIITIK